MKRRRKDVTRLGYTADQAAAGTKASLPPLDSWPNQYRGYDVRIDIPEYTSVCPKTGLPDFGTIRIEYEPGSRCVELKSLRNYIFAFRDIGIFNENTVNRILKDFVQAVRPVRAVITGTFSARGGMTSTVTARYGRKR